LAILEDRSINKELDCFLGVENDMLDILKDNNLANKTARDWFV